MCFQNVLIDKRLIINSFEVNYTAMIRELLQTGIKLVGEGETPPAIGGNTSEGHKWLVNIQAAQS